MSNTSKASKAVKNQAKKTRYKLKTNLKAGGADGTVYIPNGSLGDVVD